MPGSDQKDPVIRITAEDLASVALPEPARRAAGVSDATPGVNCYGTIHEDATPRQAGDSRGSILLQGWCYLGLAGLAGALLAWAICEPAFEDGKIERWGNALLLPAVLALLCVGFGVAESVVERSTRKGIERGLLGLLLGIMFGFVFDGVANIVYSVTMSIAAELGAETLRNPAFWIARGVGWSVFGAGGGIVYGIVGRSYKQGLYGAMGGALGAGIGGTVFDPIAMLLNAAEVSRAVGFALLGSATGIAMGLVESALKDRWLYVSAGPLAGKQFILYKTVTRIGSRQQNDIYLFKDSSVLGEHAVVEMRGREALLRALGPVWVAGQPSTIHALKAGDLIQIGRYSFRYFERQKSR